MKQKWLSAGAALLFAAVLAGCTAHQPQSQVQNPVQDPISSSQQSLAGFDAESTTPSSATGTPAATGTPSTPSTSSVGTQITAEQAKEIALSHAGVNAASATFVKCQLDYENGRQVYELEWYANGTKYEYDVAVSDGTVVSTSYESTATSGVGSGVGTAAGVAVSEDAARQTALARVSGATAADIYEWEFDYDDGRPEYEGKIIYGGMEYEFTIDATTGVILEWDTERLRI